MLDIGGSKYVKVWRLYRPQKGDSVMLADISSSKKDTRDGDVKYENMSWRARFVGEAYTPSESLSRGDTIDIVRGAISNSYDKEKKRLYVEVTIFEFALSDPKTDTGTSANLTDSDEEAFFSAPPGFDVSDDEDSPF